MRNKRMKKSKKLEYFRGVWFSWWYFVFLQQFYNLNGFYTKYQKHQNLYDGRHILQNNWDCMIILQIFDIWRKHAIVLIVWFYHSIGFYFKLIHNFCNLLCE